MKKPIKQLLTATLITAAASSAIASSYGEKGEYRDCKPGKHSAMMKHRDGFMGGHQDPKEMLEREFETEEISILMQARLLMKGNENLKVGKIEKTKTGYTVTVVTQDNSLVEELQLAPNGMPLKKFERIKAHMEKRGER